MNETEKIAKVEKLEKIAHFEKVGEIGETEKLEKSGVKIIYSCNDFVVAEKPHNLPTAPLKECEKNTALEAVLLQFESGRNVFGKKNIEHGLVHRLDTATHGLFVVALNQNAFENLWAQQQNGTFTKVYTAFCTMQKAENFPNCNFCLKNGEKITSLFRYYGKGRTEVRPVACEENCKSFATKKAENGKYTTLIEKVEELKIENIFECLGSGENIEKTKNAQNILAGGLKNFELYKNKNIFSVQCSLTKGFKHQIRAHLAWLGFPLIGDFLYCPIYKQASQIEKKIENIRRQNIPLQLHATQLKFLHPITGEQCNFCINAIPSF